MARRKSDKADFSNETTGAEHVADQPAESSAADRLRAFEDEKLGADTPRHEGKVERGSGSLYSRMSDEDRAQHARLERLVEAEQKLADARMAMAAAEEQMRAAQDEIDAAAK